MQSMMLNNDHIISIKEVTIDVSMLYEVAGNDVEFLKLMAATFLNTVPSTMLQMEQQFAAANYEAVSKLAHFLKSSFSIIKVSGAFDLAKEIEQLTKVDVQVEMVRQLINQLNQKVAIAVEAIIERFEPDIKTV